MPSFSNSLEQAIHHSLALANARKHGIATLEHLLLALTQESSAAEVLHACCNSVTRLRTSLREFIDDDLQSLVEEAENTEAQPTEAYQRVIQRAAIHIQASGRENVTGANVLIAIFAERQSNAAFFLQEEKMTRYDAVNFVAHGYPKKEDYKNTYDGDNEVVFIDDGRDVTDSTANDTEKIYEERGREKRQIFRKFEKDHASLALLARSISLQVTTEIENQTSSKPNFSSSKQAEAFERHIDFLESLAKSLDELAEGLARMSADQSNDGSEELAEKTQTIRDRVLTYVMENSEDARFYCMKMPAMLGSIALFSSAGAHMTTATPILMALFGGDRIVNLVNDRLNKR